MNRNSYNARELPLFFLKEEWAASATFSNNTVGSRKVREDS